MNKLELLRIFVRVAELSSFTKAAISLGLPKASVSASVRGLEDLVGARLLHRTTRKVQTTQDGQALYERGKDLLADMDELEVLFQRGSTTLKGRLRVDMPTGVAKSQIIPRLGEFMRNHPELEIEISSTDRRVDLVREGFDCVLRIGELDDSSLIARPLGSFIMANCASPAYLAEYGIPQSLADLGQHRLIRYASVLGVKPLGWEYLDGGQYRQQAMPGVITVNNTEAYQAACLAGLGLIQAPLLGLQPHIANGSLLAVLPDFTAPPMPVCLVYANRRHLPRRVQVFMDWVSAIIAQHMAQGQA